MAQATAVSRRLATVAGHLAPPATHASISMQACAATQATLFARPATDDVAFAKPESFSVNGYSSMGGPRYARPVPEQEPQQEVAFFAEKSSPAAEQKDRTQNWSPKVTITETTNFRHLDVALPGVKARDLQLLSDGTHLKLSGQRKETVILDMHLALDARGQNRFSGRGQVTRKEVDNGSFSLAWRLPPGCDIKGIAARSAPGRLMISLPKSA